MLFKVNWVCREQKTELSYEMSRYLLHHQPAFLAEHLFSPELKIRAAAFRAFPLSILMLRALH